MKKLSRARILSFFILPLAFAFLVYCARTLPSPGERSKLPIGSIKPALALSSSHGIILASDGSLWSWGAEDWGWPVLGLGKTRPQARLRRIGHETNWVNIAASGSHTLAVKSDGSLWA